MIEAGERHQLDQLFIAPLGPQRGPESVAHLRPVVELVDQVEEQSGLVDSAEPLGYRLTALGRGLIEQFLPLVDWSTRWAAALTRARGSPRSSR